MHGTDQTGALRSMYGGHASPSERPLTNDWRHWGIARWNERLLAHFFGRRSEDEGPVTTLLATREEIARATGDSSASPDEVHDTFIATVLHTVRNGSILDTAADYRGFSAPPLDDETPPFVSCLIFTCIAAAESSEDLAREGSFVARLRALTNGNLPELSLQLLPTLWENLASWLSNNRKRYRELRLPDPGGLTRIGYTTKLAFPDRRDQRELSELLDREGLLGHEPPMGKVLSLIARERNRFRPPFQAAMEEFRRLFTNATERSGGRLLEHRFWSAVREAALRGRGREDVLELVCRVQFLAELADDQLSLLVVTDAPLRDDETFSSIELPITYGPWRYALVERSHTGALENEALERPVASLLSSAHRIQPLSAYVEQGILPFVETTHGLLELASMDALDAANIALVRSDLQRDLIELFGNTATRASRSRYEGWVQVEYPSLSSLPSERLENSSLHRCWMLYSSVRRPAVTFLEGIRTDDAWLGLREVLPKVRAPGAIAVVARIGTDNVSLLRDSTGSWSFPVRDYEGGADVEASTSGGEVVARTARFVLAPTNENYKTPTDPAAWIIESVGSTSTATVTLPFLEASVVSAPDATRFAERTTLLGQQLGEFVDDPSRAAWIVSEFGTSVVGRRSRMELAAPPTAQASSAPARRRWRRLLLQCDADPTDPEFLKKRHLTRQVIQRATLPEVDFTQISSAEEKGSIAKPHPGLERLIGAIAARANVRAGISWLEWSVLLQRFLGIEARYVDGVTRAWQEFGAIDVLAAARWRHRSIFARQPTLATYRCGSYRVAVLVGLSLPSSQTGLATTARKLGAEVEERGSVSPHVPPTIAVRTTEDVLIEKIARSCGLGTCGIDLSLDRFALNCTHDVTSAAPYPYLWSKRWPAWSLTERETPAGPEVVHWLRDDRPGYWQVSHDGLTAWSYDLNTVRWWAARLANQNALRLVGGCQLDAHHAYLPLPIARLVSLFSTAHHGPEPSFGWRYRYSFVTRQLFDEILGTLQAAFDPRLLRRV